MTARMKLLLCTCAVLGLSAGIGTGVAVYIRPEPVLLACPDIQAIPETRVVTLIEAWPVPPEATPIPGPRRSVQRKRQTLIPPSMPAVEQCAPPAGFYGPEPQVQHVPEPNSASIAFAGLLALAAVGRMKGKK